MDADRSVLGRFPQHPFIAHDLNQRAISPRVRGFVQARTWFQDLSPVDLA